MLPLSVLAISVGSTETAAQSAGNPTFGPRLFHYPMQCKNKGGCRIACYQHGTAVIVRDDITPTDKLRLVVNSRLRDERVPRWIVVRSRDGTKVQTILLSDSTVCDLQSLSIDSLQSIQ